jgi:hypothetical protein
MCKNEHYKGQCTCQSLTATGPRRAGRRCPAANAEKKEASPALTAFDPGSASLLDLCPLYQSPDPIEQSLIDESGRQTMVMVDLAVKFDAPVTHSIPPFF